MDLFETTFLYAGILLFAAAYPLAQSFEKRIRYVQQWKHLLPAILVMCLIFIPWDIWFAAERVWWFNDNYLTGYRIFGLPVEEWLFFLIVPFACIFIYEVLGYFVKKDIFKPIARTTFSVLALLFFFSALYFYQQLYTVITFLSTAVALAFAAYFNPKWSGRFLFMYLVSLIPFLLVNGALTGNFTSEAVVNYNAAEHIGWRITTIPIEDSVYNLLMLLIVVAVYEARKNATSNSMLNTEIRTNGRVSKAMN